MISGVSAPRRGRQARLLALVLAMASCLAGAAEAADSPGWDLKRLMHDLGEVKTAKGRFVERKYVAILTAPLEFSGTLLYIAPNRLEKHTLKPRTESLLLERDELVIESKNPDRRRALKLRNYPVVQVFVESVRSTLAGDLALLNRFFEIGLQGDERSWRLLLKPNDPKMQEVMSEVRISGNGSWIDTIEFLEAGGDRSVMSITRDEP
jgi:hypothetical protein